MNPVRFLPVVARAGLVLPLFAGFLPGRGQTSSSDPIETLVPLTTVTRSPSDGAVIPLKDGTLLWVWCRATRTRPYVPISGNLSRDNGRTWSEPFVLKLDDGQPMTGGFGSPNPVRLKSGALGMVIAGTGEQFFHVSRDEGKTWTQPVRIHPEHQKVATTNDRAIVLPSGRVVVPVYTSLEGPKLPARKPVIKRGGGEYSNGWIHWLSSSYVITSDDEGKTWERSDNEVFVALDQGMAGTYPAFEPAIADFTDGRLVMFVRTNLGHFFRSYSKDQGKTWLEAQPVPLITSTAPCSLRRIPGSDDLLVIWNQISALEDMEGLYRHRLSCAISSDGGETWKHFKNLESLDDTARLCDEPVEPRLMGPVRQPHDRKRYFRAPGPLRVSYPSCVFADGKAIITYGLSTLGERDIITATYGMNYDEVVQKLGYGPEARANKVRILPISWFYEK